MHEAPISDDMLGKSINVLDRKLTLDGLNALIQPKLIYGRSFFSKSCSSIRNKCGII